MDTLIFPLKIDLVVPATGNPNKGELLWRAGKFGLSYEISPKPKLSRLDITLTVVEITTGDTVWQLDTFEITEAGFPHRLNYNDIIAAEEAVQEATEDWKILQVAFEAADEAFKLDDQNPDLLEAYTIAYEAATQKQQEVLGLIAAVPDPIIVYVNKYSDVVKYLKGDGTFTSEGVEWAKAIPFLDKVIGYFI